MSTSSTATPGSTQGVPAEWAGLIDDAAIFPPGNSPLPDAVTAFHTRRREQWYAPLVSSFVVSGAAVGDIESPTELPVSLVVGGGPDAVHKALSAAATVNVSVVAVEVALRDPSDLSGAVRRTAAVRDIAQAGGLLASGTPVYVELPQSQATGGWLDAVCVAGERGLLLKFRTGGVTADLFPSPHTLASWIDAAVNSGVPFKCTAGLHNAVRHTADDGFVHHGFLNVMAATDAAADGADIARITALLTEENSAELAKRISSIDVAAVRRRFVSHGSCSVTEPLEDLLTLELLEGPQ